MNCQIESMLEKQACPFKISMDKGQTSVIVLSN